MKKVLIFLILVCLFSVCAFAQLNVGGYTKSYWTVYRLTLADGEDPIHTTAVQAPWGEPDISAGMNFDGWSQWGGLHLGIDIANGAGNQSAHPKSAKGSGWVWVKPFNFVNHVGMDTFTIWLGNPVDEKLMGKIGGSNLSTYVLNNGYSIHADGKERDFRLEIQNPQYNTFTRMSPYPWGNANINTQDLWWPRVGAAAMLTWEPIKNLYINAFFAPEFFNLDTSKGSSGWLTIGGIKEAALISVNGEQLNDIDINQDFYSADKTYKKLQIGAGYDIPGIGFARAQWIGARNVMEAAFQVKALGDIMLDIGLKVPFEGTDKTVSYNYKRRKDFGASVAATYRFYDFRFLGRIDTAFAGSDSRGRVIKQRGLDLIAYLVPSYQISVGTVGLDLGFEYEQKDDFNAWAKDSMQGGMGVWFHRSMGNAQFKAAVVSRFPFEWAGKDLPFELFFPIVCEVGF